MCASRFAREFPLRRFLYSDVLKYYKYRKKGTYTNAATSLVTFRQSHII